MICSLVQVFTLTQVLFIAKVHLLPPGSGEQGQMPFQEHGGGGVCVCARACLFVYLSLGCCESSLVCLFLKSPRGSFWQKAPPEQAWTRVCFGWKLRRSAYEETRGEEKCQARGLRIWLCYVMWSSGRDKNKQKIRNKLCPPHDSNLSKSHWKYFHLNFLPLLCVLCDGATLVLIEISGKLPTLGWSNVNPLLGERSREMSMQPDMSQRC